MERHEHRRIVQVWFWISVGFALAMLAFPAPKLVNENVREPPDVVVIPHTAEYEFVELNRFGTSGSGNGQFSGPLGVALNTSGYVYVVDSYSNRVQVFTQTGQFVRTWGSSGSGNGNFISPDGIAVNASGYVYVADWGNHRVQVFTQTGQFVRTWGSYGSGDGLFIEPRGLALDTLGNVYVADAGNYRVQVFTQTGQFVTKWGSQGWGNGQFIEPWGIAVNPSSGNVYVTDRSNCSVQVFTSTGTFLNKWGGHEGSGNGELFWPIGIAVNSSGYVYVVEAENGRVQVFTSTGTYVHKWIGFGDFFYPWGIAVNGSGFAYMTDLYACNVRVFGPDIYPPNIVQVIECPDPLELGSTAWVWANITDQSLTPPSVRLERGGVQYAMVRTEYTTLWNLSWVPNSVGTIDYTVWATDTCGNTNSFSDSITVVDTTAPMVTFLLDSDPLELGSAAWVHANFSDYSGINQIKFEREGQNKSMLFDDDLDLWISPTWTPATTGQIDYAIWARDTIGNWRLENGSITVQDTRGPSITLVESGDPLELGTAPWIRAVVTDNSSVASVLFERDGINYTMTDEGEGIWFSGSWVPDHAGPISYTVWANDSSGNWGFKSGTITVQDTVAPAITPASDLFITTTVAEGHFPATYSFSSSTVDLVPAGFISYSPAQTTCRVIANYAGHAQVLELFDGNNIDYCGASVSFPGQGAGLIECYLAVTAWGGENGITIRLENGTGESGLALSLRGGALELWNVSNTVTLSTGLNAGEFYHVLVFFECAVGSCLVYLNGTLMGNSLFNGPGQGEVTGVSFRTSASNFNGISYSGCVDAIDFSWDFSYETWRGLPHVTWAVTDACTSDKVIWNVTRNGVLWRNGTGYTTGVVPVGSLEGGDIILVFNVTDGYTWVGDSMTAYVNQVPQINVSATLVEYPHGSTGHLVYWNITDREATESRRYTIYKNGSPWSLVDNAWVSGALIPLSVDGLGYGDHAITLVVTDGYGGQNESTTIISVWDPYTNGTWQDVSAGLQVITCARWGVTWADLDLEGTGAALRIAVTAFLPGAFPTVYDGALAYFEVELDGTPAGASWPTTGRFYYDPSFIGAADESNLALYRREGTEWILVGGARLNADAHLIVADVPGAGEYVIAPGPVVYDPTMVAAVSCISAFGLGAMVIMQRKGTLVIWQRRRAVKRAFASLDRPTTESLGLPTSRNVQ